MSYLLNYIFNIIVFHYCQIRNLECLHQSCTRTEYPTPIFIVLIMIRWVLLCHGLTSHNLPSACLVIVLDYERHLRISLQVFLTVYYCLQQALMTQLFSTVRSVSSSVCTSVPFFCEWILTT